MAVHKDYIPTKDADLAPWSANFTEQVAENAATWGIPPAEVADLQAAVHLFRELLVKRRSTECNIVTVCEKNIARKALVARIRTMASFRLKNPAVDNTQRTALGLHVRDTIYTKIQAPDTGPDIEVRQTDARRLALVIRIIGNIIQARPYGTVGATVVYAVLDTPPLSIDELTSGLLVTRSPFYIIFDDAHRGKTVYFAACWQGKGGKRSPWSDIKKAIVP
jgi:hypothetical protein